jgi:hypothetical protein
MTSVELNPQRDSDMEIPLSSSSGFWENRLAPFLEKYCLVLCVCLVGIACARILSTYNALSLTSDEPSHLACGMQYVADHVYRLEVQHPPLSRAIQALGPYIMGARPMDMPYEDDEGIAVIANSGNVNRTIFLMRLGNLPFFLLACAVVCTWSWRTLGKPEAVLATGLFTLLPTILADAGLATTDMALGATVGAAFLATLFWAEKPTWTRAILLGFCVALAFLSKFTALGYLPAAALLAFVSYLGTKENRGGEVWRLATERFGTLLIAVTVALFLIWTGYWFSFGSLQLHGRLSGMKLPAPEFFDGIRESMRHDRVGHAAFLFGEFRWKGWWYYFPVVLGLKTPIAFLILFGVGVFGCIKSRASAYLLPIAFSLGILLPALISNVNLGVRHVEPIYLGFSMTAAIGLKQVLQWARTRLMCVVTAGALLIWLVISVALHHPDYIAYVNAFAGKTPERILNDSNYDWGQDLKLLAKHLNQMGVQRFSLASYDGVGVDYPDYLEAWYGLPKVEIVRNCVPSPGWNVVSTTVEKTTSQWPGGGPFYRGPGAAIPWYEQIPPTQRLGPLLLFSIPENSNLNCR